MKKLFVLLLSVATLTSYAQWETVKGNGVLKKETRDVSNYTGLHVEGSMNVQVSYGSQNMITVEADENILPYIETKVENGNLVIKNTRKVNLKSKNKIVVHASLTNLEELYIAGSGSVTGQGNFSNNGKTLVKLAGSGDVNMGIGTISELEISISGSGNVKLQGTNCDNITANISGSGNIDCSNLKTNDVFAKVSGSGNIRVYATSSIDAKVSGSGNIYYKGSANKVNLKSSGSGKIIKA